MTDVLGQFTALLFCGVAWRILQPFGMDADRLRQAIATLVFVLLLPALVLLVIWRAPLGSDSLWIAFIAAAATLGGAGLGWLLYRPFGLPGPVMGALVMAAGWPNSTYLGLPVLEEALGPWARSVAIQYDLFACTPLLLTVGILMARRFGDGGGHERWWISLIKVPPLWAALLGIALNLSGVPLNPWVEGFLNKLGPSVPPLMLLALGMGLRWDTLRPNQIALTIPVLVVQLFLAPLIAVAIATAAGLNPELRAAITLEAAMPTMVLGIVLCDRYGLDGGLYASTVTLSTLLSLITLPLWFGWLLPG